MKNFINIIVLIGLVLLSQGCMQATYTPPKHENNKENYTVVIDNNFNETWKKLIGYSASTFFAIDNYEKDSGLITLSFGASEPSEFITGGHWTAKTAYVNFDGEYVDYLVQNFTTEFSGRMNIVVTEIDENRTRVQVNSRYVLSSRGRNGGATVWAFDTGRCDSKKASSPANGLPPERTICPTYKAENALINAIK